ncbi:hypothetical protein ABPG72_006881 [Tetrahymena utriculariae]
MENQNQSTKQNEKESFSEKSENHKPKDLKIHTYSEQIQSLSNFNKKVARLDNVKGINVQERVLPCKSFSWTVNTVFDIYEADAQGKRLDNFTPPIFQAVLKYQKCACKSTDLRLKIEIRLKTEDHQKEEPFLVLNENQSCCSYGTCQISIKNNENEQQIGQIQQGFTQSMKVYSSFINQIQFKAPLCQSFSKVIYNVQDSENNKASLLSIMKCRSEGINYEVGFPSTYNTNKKVIYLASIVYLGLINSEQKHSG